MRDIMVMNAIWLKFISNEIKNLVSALLTLIKKVFKAWLSLQFNIMAFPVYFLYGGFKYVCEQYLSDFFTEIEYPPEPKSEAIVEAVKKLQNSVLSSINAINLSRSEVEIGSVETLRDSRDSDTDEQNEYENKDEVLHQMPNGISNACSLKVDENKTGFENKTGLLAINEFTGNDLMWDVPIIAYKARYYAQCVKEKNEAEIKTAKQSLENYPTNEQMPKTRHEYDRLLNETKNGSEYLVSYADIEPSDSIETESAANSFTHGNEQNISNVLDSKQRRRKLYFDDILSNRKFSNGKITAVAFCNQIPPREAYRILSEINGRLKNLYKINNSLFQSYSSLSNDLNTVISARDKMTNLLTEIEEGKKILQEVETDRSLMKLKLETLEQLINEQEEYLNEISCESGFDETENDAESP